MDDDAGPRQTVDAVERAFAIVSALRELNGAGITELSERLNMSKSGVHKQLSTLVNEGYVTQTGDEYRLNFKFLFEGEYVRRNSSFHNIGAPQVEELARRSGDFAYLVALEHDNAYCIHTAEGENANASWVQVGNRVSFHSSAAGKAILSQLSAEARDGLLTGPLQQKTKFTITDRDELEDELEAVQDHSIAFEDEEKIRGLRSVAAPVQLPESDVLGAVAVSGPLSLLTDERFGDDLPELVLQAKNIIEVKISHGSQGQIQEGSHVPTEFY